MQSAVEAIGPCKKKLSIEISGDEVKKAFEESMGHLRRNAVLPGFRKGHVPPELIERRFGKDVLKEVKGNLIVDNYRKALEEHKIEPVSDPDLDVDAVEMKEGEPLRYEVVIETWPTFEVEGYEGLKLEKPSTQPGEQDIDSEINALRMRTTTFEPLTDEGACETDVAITSYKITVDGAEVASAEEAGIRPADEVVGRMKVAGLKEALLGKKAGEKVELSFQVDAEYYQEEHRGKDASLVVEIKDMRRPRVPEATDEWAKELGFESLSELREVVARNVAAARERDAEEALRSQVYDRLLEKMDFELPEDAVRRQQKDIISRERLNLSYRGASEDDIAKVSDKLEEASMERAARDLKLYFILSKIADKEGIKPTSADVEMKVAEMAARYRTTAAKMLDRLKNEDMLPQIALQIREDKTVSHILSKAEIAEAAPPEGQEAPEPTRPRIILPPGVKAEEASNEGE